MHWIIDLILRHRNGTSLFVTVLISLILLNSPETTQERVVKYLGLSIFSPIQFTVTQIEKIGDLINITDSLRHELTLSQVEAASLRATVAESENLIDGIMYRDSSTYTLIPARVVVREPTFLYRTIVIDAGIEDSVGLYMPVVSADGIVGKVIRVMDRSSLVHLIRKPDEFVSVTHPLSGAVGILNAGSKNTLEVEFRKHRDLAIGDTIVSSGYGGIYPPQLPVAVVTEITDAQNPLYNLVTVEPTVQFDNLRHLFVIALGTKWQGYQMELDSLMRGGLE